MSLEKDQVQHIAMLARLRVGDEEIADTVDTEEEIRDELRYLIEALKAGMRGPVILPDDPRYDEARRIWAEAKENTPDNPVLRKVLERFMP